MTTFTHRVAFTALLFGSAVLTLALSGCAPVDTAAPPAAPQVTATVVRMEPAQTRAEIATNFPVEVAVAEGQVLRGEAQGPGAWDYEIVVVAPPATVAAWYREQYRLRSWELVESQDPASGAVRLTLRKGSAESEVTIEPMGKGSGSKVRAILSTSERVLEAQ